MQCEREVQFFFKHVYAYLNSYRQLPFEGVVNVNPACFITTLTIENVKQLILLDYTEWSKVVSTRTCQMLPFKNDLPELDNILTFSVAGGAPVTAQWVIAIEDENGFFRFKLEFSDASSRVKIADPHEFELYFKKMTPYLSKETRITVVQEAREHYAGSWYPRIFFYALILAYDAIPATFTEQIADYMKYLEDADRQCNVCKRWRDFMSKCSGCQRVYYCSHACQFKDWKRGHREVCKQ